MTATATKGSHDATAKAAPAAAADRAVQAVSLVANNPWIRPTSEGADPWVSRDWTAGRAAANPEGLGRPRAGPVPARCG